MLSPKPPKPPTIAAHHGSHRIRSYNLFGESQELPDVLHCETIAARSALHDWELAPHRHGRLHQLLLLQRGAGTAWLEEAPVVLHAPVLVNVPAGEVHAFRFRPGARGWVTTLADEMLDELLAQVSDARRTLSRPCSLPADARLEALMAQLAEEFEGRDGARALVLRGLCATLLGLAARTMELHHHPQADRPVGAGDNTLLRRFEALLEAHYAEHWSVAHYARTLAVTPTHLSRITRAGTGLSASRLIDERLVREARRHLAYTQARIKSVADALGFADPAYFTRVFTRATGVSPKSYREKLAPRVSAMP